MMEGVDRGHSGRKSTTVTWRTGTTACRWWAGAAIVLAAVLLVQAETKALRSIGNDFTAYLEAAGALAAGANPYHVAPMFPYSYPLTLAWWLIPLRLVPIWIAAAVWFSISAFAYWRMVTHSASTDGDGVARCEAMAIAVIVAIALLQVVQNELLNGQVNLVVCALSLAAVVSSQRGRALPAAVLWGAGVSLKLFPLILGPWFLLRRKWVELVLGGIVAVVLALVPVAWTGADALRWTSEYLIKISGGQAGSIGAKDFIDLNLARAIGRYSGLADTPRWLPVAAALVLVGWAMFRDWQRGLHHGVRAAAGYLALVVLLSPKSETHHMIFTIPAVIVLGVSARTWTRLVALAALIVVFNIGFVTASVRDPFLQLFALGIAAWCLAE
jgi:hypothetical protein